MIGLIYFSDNLSMGALEGFLVFGVSFALGIFTGIWLKVRFRMENMNQLWKRLLEFLKCLRGDACVKGSALDNKSSLSSKGSAISAHSTGGSNH